MCISVTVPWLIWLRRIWVGSKCKSSPGKDFLWDSENLPPVLTFLFWNFPSHMLWLPCDQVLLVSLITINDGHLHRHPVQVHHSPHLTRIHINHLQGQPTRTNATTRSTKLVFSLPGMEVCWQRHPGPARWWSSEGFRWLSCHTTIKVFPHILFCSSALFIIAGDWTFLSFTKYCFQEDPEWRFLNGSFL